MDNKPKDLLCLEGISCMNFNKNETFAVLSKKDNNLYIYEVKNKLDVSTWELVETLKSHLQYVAAVDWHPETNKIISASHDKNILIWSFNTEKKNWIPELVNFKVKVSILDVKWSQRGDKFVAATGGKSVSTGYYDQKSGMWTCNYMKDHKSAVTCARLDPSGLFLVSGSTDLKFIISSSYIPEVDDKYTYSNLPFTKVKYGEAIFQETLSGWVNTVAWSPSGMLCFVATHDANLTVLNAADQSTTTVNLSHSPISILIPISETLLCTVAFDRHVYLYELDNNEWKLKTSLTKSDSTNKSTTTPSIGMVTETAGGGIQERLKQFQGGFQKKVSLIVTTTVQKNIHLANINSATLVDNKFIVTADYAGFIKYWPINKE